MANLTIHTDCENAPKKLLMRDLGIGFVLADVKGILDHFPDDIHWQLVGEADLHGTGGDEGRCNQ